MEDSFPKIWSNHIFNVEAGVIQRRPIRIYWRAARVQHHDRLWYCICDQAKFALILAEFFLSLFQSFDVGAGSVPSDDVSRFVAKWLHANEEPTKDFVVPAKSGFDLAWFS